MGYLTNTAARSKHSKENAVLVALESERLLQSGHVGIGESAAIKVVEKVCGAAIHLEHH